MQALGKYVKTSRGEFYCLVKESKNQAVPILWLHGNFSSSAYWQEFFPGVERTQIAPDLRGYGKTKERVVDATLGVKQWSEDVLSILDSLGIKEVHVVGWSIGGGIALQLLLDAPQRFKSISLVCPVSPFGFGGTKDISGTLLADDFAGTGGGCVNPEFAKRAKNKDKSADSPFSPRNIINSFYFKAPFRSPREEDLLEAALEQEAGDTSYPGDFVTSLNWPGVAPGVFGPLNAVSPKYFNVSAIVNLKNKLPILWLRGESDLIISDQSFFDLAALGKLGYVPGWPGDLLAPPQPMIGQTKKVLEEYKAKGGDYIELIYKDAAHSPHLEQSQKFLVDIQDFWKKHE